MADTEQVSSTTANEVEEAPKVQELGTGDFIDNEAAVKVVEEETEMPSETLLHSGSTSKQLTELSAPPEEPQTVEVISAPEPEAPASVTSTVGDATEQLTKEEEEEVAVTSTHKADAVPETLDVKSEPEKKQIEELAEKVISLEAEVSEQVVSAAPVVETVITAPIVEPEETFKATAVEEPSAAPAKEPPSAPAPSLVDLLYWRDVKTTGVVFGASLLLLLSLSVCSIISVFSYVALALLSVTIIFRIYKGILQAIQKSDEGHPFKLYLDQDLALSEDLVHKYSDLALGRINSSIRELRRLFLVEDLVDSLKFAVFMWILTYVGALFNGLTLLILGLVSAFSLPIIYEKHQTQIDQYIALVNNQIKDIIGKIQAKVPGLKKKTE
ncbi:reticulon-4b isoform X3 [Chanos chanos]|uniref:Reticulon n=1 Tax=Chanos chanos TaxID=29144 RepID=A0A6J2V7T0_CHACN|nr:reticulon-3-like isoform X3 [Chanos chanos]